MTIQHLAQELAISADRLPVEWPFDALNAARYGVDGARTQAYSLLGTGNGSRDVYAAIEAVDEAIRMALEVVDQARQAADVARATIATVAAYHQ